MKGFIAAIAAVGVIRFILSVSGLPNSTVKFVSMSVVILAGVNDVYQGRAIEDVTGRLERIYDDAAHVGIKVVAATIVPYNTATPEQNAKMHAINQWIADYAARDPNVELADTRKAAASPDNRDKLAGSPDGLHPDVNGYRRMGEAIEAVLVKLFK